MLSADMPFAPRRDVHRYGTGQLTPTSLAEPSSSSPATAGAHAHNTRASRQNAIVHRLDSLLEHSSQFERLVTGRESEAGEAPPSYEEVVGLAA